MENDYVDYFFRVQEEDELDLSDIKTEDLYKISKKHLP